MSKFSQRTGRAGPQTYRQAALTILSSAGRPLTTREITDLAIERGLITPQGSTPVATMAAALYREVAKDAELVKVETPGETRALKGTVRWTIGKPRGAKARRAKQHTDP